MPTAKPLLRALGLSLALASLNACVINPSTSEPSQYPAKDRYQALLLAQQALDARHYQEAEQQFVPLSDASQPQDIRQLALTGLVLVYLDSSSPRFNIDRAIDAMDQVNAALSTHPQQRLQFNSLRLLLEQTVNLKQAEAQRLGKAQEVIRLQAQVKSLEGALDSLRRLSLE